MGLRAPRTVKVLTDPPLRASVRAGWVLAALCLVGAFASSPPRADNAFDAPAAIVVNVTEQDLNKILQSAIRASGGPRFEGRKSRVTRGMTDMHYRVEISDPAVSLREGGNVSVKVDILDADLTIERVERKVGQRMAYCENVGAAVDPAHPVGVEAAVRLSIADGRLHLEPESVSVSNPKSIRLIRPSRCGHAPLPRWLIWWLGKGRLRRELGRLDSVLLARATTSAAKLDQSESFMGADWKVRPLDGSGDPTDLRFYPQSLDTGGGSLLMSFGCSNTTQHPRAPRPFEWSAPHADQSFVAVSRSFLNNVMALAFSGRGDQPRRTNGDFRRLLNSDSIYSLIPGLREMKSRKNVSFSLGFGSPPEIEFQDPSLEGSDSMDGSMIRVHLSGAQIGVWEDRGGQPVLLGKLRIDSGTIGILPQASVIGGISLKLLQNDWHVSSEGIEFNDELFSATLQELVFAQAFETHGEPLLEKGLRLGASTLKPQAFSAVDDYLVVRITGF